MICRVEWPHAAYALFGDEYKKNLWDEVPHPGAETWKKVVECDGYYYEELYGAK